MVALILFEADMHDYIPVNCGFYDQLEAFATLGTACQIAFRQQEARAEVHGRITDLYVREKVEYLKMDSGLELRLDQIIHVNGIRPSYMC